MKTFEIIKKIIEDASCGGTSSGAVATTPVGKSKKKKNVGSLFGGTYQQTNEAIKKAKPFDGFQVTILQGMRGALVKGVKQLCGSDSISGQGYGDGSTTWIVACDNTKNQTPQQFEQELRGALGGASDDEGGGYYAGGTFDGWLEVEGFNWNDMMQDNDELNEMLNKRKAAQNKGRKE